MDSPPQQESKHTPLDEDMIRAFAKRIRSEPRCNSMIAADHIDELLDDRARTRRLLEAGQRLAEETRKKANSLPGWQTSLHRAVDDWDRAYQEAAKPQGEQT